MKTLLLFWSDGGDLARRMLLPSLFGLDSDGLLPADLVVVGTARSAGDDDWYRNKAGDALAEFVEPDRLKPEIMARFLARLRYRSADVSTPQPFAALAEAVGDTAPKDLSIFLSTAPAVRPDHRWPGQGRAGRRPGPPGAGKTAGWRSRLEPGDQ